MAQVERRQKKKRKSKKTKRAEPIFNVKKGGSNAKRRGKGQTSRFFERGLELDLETRVIDSEKLKKSQLIKTYTQQKKQFKKFLPGRFLKPLGTKEKQASEEVKIVEESKEDKATSRDNAGSQNQEKEDDIKEIKETKGETPEFIELEIEDYEEDEFFSQNPQIVEEKHDFIQNTESVGESIPK